MRDGYDELSEEEKRRLEELDNIPLNNHSVNLERVQRCHLGIDEEPMDFDEKSVAQMLQDLADDDRHGQAAFVLRALANALLGHDDHHKLILRQTKRGKWASPSETAERIRQHVAWMIRLDRLESQGWQTDAAVHRIAESSGKSVARIYAGMAENRELQESFRSLQETLSGIRKKKQ